MEAIIKQFPQLSDDQVNQYENMWDLYRDWNSKINVISRKDIDNLYTHHILHSLAIAKLIQFKKNTTVMDLGTGGGFPGIPLAIMFPQSEFTLIDGSKKKIHVCQEVIDALKLKNVSAYQKRAEEMKSTFDFVVTRAVAKTEKLLTWTDKLIHENHKNSLPNGLIALKGGMIKKELKEAKATSYAELMKISKYFKDPFFEEKYVVYLQR